MAVNQLTSLAPLEDNESVVEHWAHTQSKLYKINYTWTINNFSFRQLKIGEILQSPVFFSHANAELKWYLQLYPNAVNEEYKDYLSIYINLLSGSDKPEILGKCKLSVINSQLKKNEMKSFETRNFKQYDSWGFPDFIKREFLLDESNNFLPEDKLTIFCEFSFVSDTIIISSQTGIGQFKVPECKALDDFGNLLENRKFSDVTVVVGVHEFAAHKAILAARSDVFAAMFEHEMKESKLNRVNITDIDHEVLQELLHFIYTGDAPKLKEMAGQLLAAADKYALKRLKVMAEEVLFAELSLEAAAEILVLAYLHSADQLKEQTIKFINIHAKDIIKTKGWENMMSQNVNLPLIAEIIEALFTPPTQSLTIS